MHAKSGTSLTLSSDTVNIFFHLNINKLIDSICIAISHFSHTHTHTLTQRYIPTYIYAYLHTRMHIYTYAFIKEL